MTLKTGGAPLVRRNGSAGEALAMQVGIPEQVWNIRE